MKKLYESPKVRAVTISTNEMIAGSLWNEGDTSGVNTNPGGQGSFGLKEEEYDFGW